MTHYIFITFAPIQSFIEKSRKLRDLYGASLILSYLSQQLIEAAEGNNAKVISPGCPNIKKGMPNRILLTGNFSETDAENVLIAAWSQVLERCRTWLEEATQEFRPGKYTYTWKSEWDKWICKTWEVFWGTGDSPEEARKDLENRKLARQWTAINWIGESSSI
ncbi:MAG: type III-B CRISPR-associated protein Cas10/Cmr2, partial [Geitlerinemataceae cyanobacterium]